MRGCKQNVKRPQLLLLDDIVSHLDETRRRTLFELTADLQARFGLAEQMLKFLPPCKMIMTLY